MNCHVSRHEVKRRKVMKNLFIMMPGSSNLNDSLTPSRIWSQIPASNSANREYEIYLTYDILGSNDCQNFGTLDKGFRLLFVNAPLTMLPWAYILKPNILDNLSSIQMIYGTSAKHLHNWIPQTTFAYHLARSIPSYSFHFWFILFYHSLYLLPFVYYSYY